MGPEASGDDLALVHEFVQHSRLADRATMARFGGGSTTRPGERRGRSRAWALFALTAIEECAPTLLAQQALLTALAMLHTTPVLPGHTNRVQGVSWALDGRRLATASNDCTARVWDVEQGTVACVLLGHDAAVWAVAWSPDGRLLATASSDWTARLWETSTCGHIHTLHGHVGWVEGVAWSPDGRAVATASRDKTARIWDAASGQERRVLRGHEDWVRDVAWSPEGQRLATASRDGTARVWDATTGEELLALRGHRDWVRAVAWSPGGERIATASRDGTARVWQIDGIELVSVRGHDDCVEGVDWAPDGERLATASADHSVRLWDARREGTDNRPPRYQDWVREVSWSPDGERIATASHAIRPELGHRPARAGAGIAWPRRCGLGIDLVARRTLSRECIGDGTARVWDLARRRDRAHPRRTRRRRGRNEVVHRRRIYCHDLARPNGRSLGVGPPELLTPLRGHNDWVESADWAPNGKRLVTVSGDGTALVWDVASGNAEIQFTGHDDWIDAVAWSPDGQMIATGSRDGTARVWSAATGDQIVVLPGHGDWVNGLAWSPDGTQLTTVSPDRTAILGLLARGLVKPHYAAMHRP